MSDEKSKEPSLTPTYFSREQIEYLLATVYDFRDIVARLTGAAAITDVITILSYLAAAIEAQSPDSMYVFQECFDVFLDIHRNMIADGTLPTSPGKITLAIPDTGPRSKVNPFLVSPDVNIVLPGSDRVN